MNELMRSNLFKTAVGFDNAFRNMFDQPAYKYPPYNIVQVEEDKYRLEVAVAGFETNDLVVEINEDNYLLVSGLQKTDLEDNGETYHYKGVSNKSFTNKWKLAPGMKVVDSQHINGMLYIHMERELPESKNKKIAISTHPLSKGLRGGGAGDP
jgi:molecular chaperone IbpA